MDKHMVAASFVLILYAFKNGDDYVFSRNSVYLFGKDFL